MNLADKAARGGGVTLAFQAVKFVVQTGSLILLARLLTPEDFGIVAMVVAITGAADLIRDFGLSLAAVQAKELNDAERTNLFWANTGIGFVCCIAVSAMAPLIAWIYGKSELVPIVFAVAGVFIVSGASTQFRAELMRSMRFTALSTTDVLANALGVGTAVLLALSGAGYWAIVAQLVMVAVATLVLSFLACRWRPGLPQRDVSIRRFFRFGGGLLGTQLLGYATKNVDSIAIGAMYGSTTLGFYNRAYQLLMTPLNQINAPLTNVALPILSKVQGDPVTYGRYLARAQLIGGYVTASSLAVSAGVALPLVTVAFGEQWPAVAPIFALLAIGGIFRSVSQICYWVYLSHGLTGAQLRLYLFLRPAVILITLAGLPWGAVGVAASSSIGFLVDWLVTLWHVHRVSGVDSMMLLRNSLRAILLFGAPAGLLAFAGSHLFVTPSASLAAGIVCALAAAAVSAAVFPSVRSDLSILLDFVGRAIGRPPRRPNQSVDHGPVPEILATSAEDTLTLWGYLAIVKKQWRTFGAVLVLTLVVAFSVSIFTPQTYIARSEGALQLGVVGTPRQISDRYPQALSLTRSFAALATSTAVLEPVIGRLRLDTSAESLARDIEVTIPAETVTLQFTVKARTAEGAAQIADAVAEQLADLTGRLIQIEQPDMLKLNVSRAPVPEFASSPRTGLTLKVGAVIGLMLAVIAAISRDWQVSRRRARIAREGAQTQRTSAEVQSPQREKLCR
ncbi:oligosaccharide flippase family protein [Rhodococcus sp. ARC_M6]|uniref:oligosaccharide flippase family protein n=1 Tax=Rhodococcus sp. ARC_M6 TaxID=2928852 RepID=UPI001FB2002F|nr:oligosaccharide flippase family protein [Rhodococcus sp. ARC_M6]MCJ0904452.1 oligosaccharide flippase family protein [Rhodococcus sp. ARC_M6]